MTYLEMVNKGYHASIRGSIIIDQYEAHSFPVITEEPDLTMPARFCYIPQWIFVLDQTLYHGFYLRYKFCCICATKHIYEHKDLKEKWSTLLSLDPTYGDKNQAELEADIKLAGLKEATCVREYK